MTVTDLAGRRSNAAWDVTATHGTVTLSMRLDDGQRAELTLLAQDAMTLVDKLAEAAEREQNRRAA